MRRQKKKGGKSAKLTRQNYKRRIIAAVVFGIVTLGLAVSTFYIKDIKAIEFIKWVASAPTVFSIPLIFGNLSGLLECQKLREVFKIIISSICLWVAVLMLVNGCVVMGAAAWNVMHAEEEDDKEKHEKEDTEEEQTKIKVPMRNGTEFTWEDDVFINDVSKYYDEPISAEDEGKYILELLKEDFENNKANVRDTKSGETFAGAYEKKTELANQYYAQYQYAVEQEFDFAVQYNELHQSKIEREEADASDRVAANLKELGGTEIELGVLEKKMGNESWQEQYVNALRHYIEGLKCSIQEVELGRHNTKGELSEVLWQRILTTYSQISNFNTKEGTMEIRANKIEGLLKKVDR